MSPPKCLPPIAKLQLTDNLSDRNRKHSPEFIPHFELNALGEVETDQIMNHPTTNNDRIITPTTTTDTLSTLPRLTPRSSRPPHCQSPSSIRFTPRKQPLQDLLSPVQKAARVKKLGDIKKKLKKKKTAKQLSKLHDEERVDTDLLATILEAFHEKRMAELEAFEDKL